MNKTLAEAVLDYSQQLDLDTVHSTSHYTLRRYRKQFGKDVFDQAKAKYFAGKDAVRWQQGAAAMWITPR